MGFLDCGSKEAQKTVLSMDGWVDDVATLRISRYEKGMS